jgi:hypothetical protein
VAIAHVNVTESEHERKLSDMVKLTNMRVTVHTLSAKANGFVDAALKQAILFCSRVPYRHRYRLQRLPPPGLLALKLRQLGGKLCAPARMFWKQQEGCGPEGRGRDVGEAGPQQRKQYRRSLIGRHLHTFAASHAMKHEDISSTRQA